jgi:hypothetical protein
MMDRLAKQERLMRFRSAAAAFVLICASTSTMAEPKKYGAGVTIEASTPLTAVLQKPGDFAGHSIRVEGTVTAVCSHEGCWMTLAPEGQLHGPTLRLKVDDGVIVFPVTAKGKRAVAQGVIERVGADAESAEAAAEHARQAPAPLSENSKNWELKATGALIY